MCSSINDGERSLWPCFVHIQEASLVAINVAWSAQRSHDLLRFCRLTAVAALLTMEHVRRAGVAAHGFTEVT